MTVEKDEFLQLSWAEFNGSNDKTQQTLLSKHTFFYKSSLTIYILLKYLLFFYQNELL